MTLNDLLAKRNQDKLTQLDRDLQETLLYAPRRLTCPWIGCSYTETIFASLDALINHVHLYHASPQLARPSGQSSKKVIMPCRWNKGCKGGGATAKELMRHILTSHLGTPRSTCFLCTFHHVDFMEMVRHLENKHGISRELHPLTNFLTPPPRPDPWPTFSKRVPSYQVMLPPVRSDPSADPNPPIRGEIGPYEILDEDLRDAEVMMMNNGCSMPKGKQRELEDRTMEIWIATNLNALSLSDPTPTNAQFHSGVRPSSPKAKFSYPVAYKSGTPVLPRRPPPVIGNFLRQKELIFDKMAEELPQSQEL